MSLYNVGVLSYSDCNLNFMNFSHSLMLFCVNRWKRKRELIKEFMNEWMENNGEGETKNYIKMYQPQEATCKVWHLFCEWNMTCFGAKYGWWLHLIERGRGLTCNCLFKLKHRNHRHIYDFLFYFYYCGTVCNSKRLLFCTFKKSIYFPFILLVSLIFSTRSGA